MRTTLDIDEDVLAAAKAMARQEHRTLGNVVSDLARKALRRPAAPAQRNGIPLLPVKPGVIVTADIVGKLRDELP